MSLSHGPAVQNLDPDRPSAKSEVSLIRLYALRAGYLLLAVGLGIVVWPRVIHHTNQYAATYGIQVALLAGIGATALVGLRYPLRMLPLLLFEVIWKVIYLTAFALPAWSAHQVSKSMAEDITACLWVVVFIPIIPWGHVFRQYALEPSERWK